MQWLQWLNLFRRSPKQAHRASFELGQAAAAEEHAVEVLEDLEKINQRKLDVLSRIHELSRRYDDGDELMAQAVEAYREGIRNLMATPISLHPADKEARREAMEGPSESSTGSPTSRRFLNCVPFTTRPSFTSRQTITRGRSISRAAPAPQNPWR